MAIPPELINKIKLLVDPETVLQYLGFHISRKTGKELRGACKVHGGDNTTAFRFNLETRTWSCYTRHCEGDTHRDLVGLVQKTLDLSFVESVRVLADLAGVSLDNRVGVSEEFIRLKHQQEELREIRQAEKQKLTINFLPEEMADNFLPYRSDYFLKRGFPEELLTFFKVGGMIDKQGVHRDTIPIRDPEGNLLTFSCRRTDSDQEPKYWLLENIPKSVTLYNLDLAKHYVGGPPDGPRVLILVEGFADVWTLVLQGVWNVVAAMGTDITQYQAELLSKFADKVILMLDPDEAGRTASERVMKFLSSYVAVDKIDLPENKDPKNFTAQDVKHYFGLKKGY